MVYRRRSRAPVFGRRVRRRNRTTRRAMLFKRRAATRRRRATSNRKIRSVVKSVMNRFVENKIKGFDEAFALSRWTIYPASAANQAYIQTLGITTGKAISSPSYSLIGNSLDLFQWPQGLTRSTRNGNFLYCKKIRIHTAINYELQDPPDELRNNPHLLIRFYVMKVKQSNSRSTEHHSFNNGMFLDENGDQFGYGTVGTSNDPERFAFKTGILNKKNFTCYYKKSFILTPPTVWDATNPLIGSSNPGVIGSSRYPSTKSWSFELPVKKRLKFGSDDRPVNYNTDFIMFYTAQPYVDRGFSIVPPVGYTLPLAVRMKGTMVCQDS